MSAVLKATPALRPMNMDDLKAVYALEISAYRHPWSKGILQDCLRVGYNCWVLEEDQAVIGYAIMSLAAGEGHILNICVQPQRQGEGLGRRLLMHLLALAQRNGADTLYLEVRASNAQAIHLYHSLGFCEIAQRANYYPAERGREDALVMAKTLMY